jgi:hypothetical protein
MDFKVFKFAPSPFCSSIAYLALIFLVSCVDSLESTPKHKSGDHRSDAASFFWISLSDADIEARLNIRPALEGASQEVTTVLQEVQSIIMELAQKTHMDHIPTPKLFIFEDSAVNGFVDSIDVCYPLALVNVSDSNGSLKEGNSTDSHLFKTTRIFKDHGPQASSFDCEEVDGSGLEKIYRGELTEMKASELAAFLQTQWPTCRFELMWDKRTLNYSCSDKETSQLSPTPIDSRKGITEENTPKEISLPHWSSSYLIVNSTIDRIFLSSGLLKRSPSFDDLFPVVAHELAHYFMAHNQESLQILISDRDGKREEGGYKTEFFPPAYVEDLRKVFLNKNIPKKEGSLYEPEVYVLIRLLFRNWSPPTKPLDLIPSESSPQITSEEWSAFKVFLDDLEIDLSSYTESYRVDYERTALKILKNKDSSSASKDLMISTEILLLTRFSHFFDRNEVARLMESLQEVKDVFIFYEILNASFSAKKTSFQNILEDALSRKLCFYTHELEADEVMLEYLKILEITPDIAIESFLKNLIENEFEEKECRSILAAEAIDKEFYLPPKNFFSEHLDPCFRVINLRKEILRHL